MGIIGRNDLCPCGSKLKYKKCCLGNDNVQINKVENSKITNDFLVNHTNGHDISFGIKELVMAELEQIIILLSEKHVHVANLKTFVIDLYELSTSPNMVEVYLKISKEIMIDRNDPHIAAELKVLRKRAKLLPSLTNNEKFILRTMMESNLLELHTVEDVGTGDYDAMKVLTEFCYQSISKGVPDAQNLDYAKLYVGSNGIEKEKLVRYELNFTEERLSPNRPLYTQWITLDSSNG
ncbi:YecA family protein [Exiguobacterium sp. s28]|uniref:YecA family protein n=1 Tax=Exiguobacterium sp. s28 TaxID=2751238 RepID=UPI001BE7AB58|nr:SEC-C domain-containing protein [Exiguobacterium sp. s28]